MISWLVNSKYCEHEHEQTKRGSRTAATSKMERFVIIVNGWKPSTTITKHSILDVAAALDPPLQTLQISQGVRLAIVLDWAYIFLKTVSGL